MPKKLRKLSGKDVVTILEQFDFDTARIRGSHYVMKREVEGQTQTITVPVHGNKPLAPGTLKNIYRLAANYISDDELRPHFYTD
jgi:predicted RNA binding protein YcfA (HicA-like mRNA interferase family)